MAQDRDMRIWVGRITLVVTGAMVMHFRQGDSARLPLLGSDHRGVWADFTLPQ